MVTMTEFSGRCDVNNAVLSLTVLETDRYTDGNRPSDQTFEQCNTSTKGTLEAYRNKNSNTLCVQFKSRKTNRSDCCDIGFLNPDGSYIPALQPEDFSSSRSTAAEDVDNWNPNFKPSTTVSPKCLSRDNVAAPRSKHMFLQHPMVICGTIDAQMAGYFMLNIRSSSNFRSSFLAYAKSKFSKHHVLTSSEEEGDEDCLKANCLISIDVVYEAKDYIDYRWGGRICTWVRKRMLLDDAMNWLNTLGGGYSALGDYFVHHSLEAARISVRQLKLALDMGDPPTVIRCHLYFGLSLMQRGYVRRAKHIIRHQFKEAHRIAANDHRLRAMCLGLWSRLRYYYSLRKRRELASNGKMVSVNNNGL